MRYIGSKASTAQWLTNFVATHAPDARSLSDPFAGTCTVSRAFKLVGYRVITGDLLSLSHTIQLATIGLNRPPGFVGLADRIATRQIGANRSETVLGYLNALPGRRHFLSKHFSASSGRMYFTDINAAKIDAIREQIAEWSNEGAIDQAEEAYLLTALVFAADKVANTAGTYYAHLKALSRKAVKCIEVVPPPLANNRKKNTCLFADAQEVASQYFADVLYLDPPYNERDYGGYYHLPESIVRNDQPTPRGRSGAPEIRRTKISDFCRPAHAESAFEQLVGQAKARYILVHYTTTGLIGHRAIMAALQRRGPVRYRNLPVRAYATVTEGTGTTMNRIYWCKVDGSRQI
jgi:adenine-specific DNA-methyltransferase